MAVCGCGSRRRIITILMDVFFFLSLSGVDLGAGHASHQAEIRTAIITRQFWRAVGMARYPATSPRSRMVWNTRFNPSFLSARDARYPFCLLCWRQLNRCGASWAFSTAAVAADRLAIQSRGSEVYPLSMQNLLACNNRGQQGCNGGHLDRAWNYMRRFG